MNSKTKIAIGVAAALGVAALALIVLSHRTSAAAAQADTSAQSGGFPNLLFSPSSPPAQIATGSSIQTDATTGIPAAPDAAASSVLAALTAAQSQITANASTAYNTNATELFKQLPGTLQAAGLTDFYASQSQDASGKTELSTHATYKEAPAPSWFTKTISFGGATSTRGAANEQAALSLAAADVLLADFGMKVPTSAADTLKAQYGVTGDLLANLRAVNPGAKLI